jgi:hypothetical protein
MEGPGVLCSLSVARSYRCSRESRIVRTPNTASAAIVAISSSTSPPDIASADESAEANRSELG